jgi:hypothetical protein
MGREANIQVHDVRRRHVPDRQRGVIDTGKGIETAITVETKTQIGSGTEEGGGDFIRGAKMVEVAEHESALLDATHGWSLKPHIFNAEEQNKLTHSDIDPMVLNVCTPLPNKRQIRVVRGQYCISCTSLFIPS